MSCDCVCKHACVCVRTYLRRPKYLLKFIYSEKATKFCEISTFLLSVCTVDKSKVEILQNFVAFSEYTNFTCSCTCKQLWNMSHTIGCNSYFDFLFGCISSAFSLPLQQIVFFRFSCGDLKTLANDRQCLHKMSRFVINFG